MEMQQNGVKKTSKYFAFISYSSDDRRWAKKLQRNLEQYRLPARLQKRYPEAPKRAFPVFRDDTHLAGFKVWASLMEELDNSQYLILICSPNSAASDWVNREVQYFIDQGKEDKILPLIIDGEPYADDPAKECFPPALLALKDPSRGIRVRSQGWRKAYLNMISTLLGVDYDELLMRDKTRRIQTGILRGLAGAAVLAAAIGVFWYFTEFTAYYNAYTLRNEAPVGIYKMSREERSHASESYRFTKYRGNVIRVECVNSFGTVIEPVMTNAFTDYPVLEFSYDKGQVVAVVQKDSTGKEISQKSLRANRSTNEIVIEFHTPSNILDQQALSADMSAYVVGDKDAENKSEITRLRNLYNDEGYLIRSMYQRDSLGTPACDSNGVYGKAYEYNEQGLIRQVYNLDENGNVVNCRFGWASEKYTYNEMGDPICSEMFDAAGNRTKGLFGYYINKVSFDLYGNPIRWEALDENGRLMCTEKGYAVQQIQFTDAGLCSSMRYFDDREQTVCSTEFYHELRFAYDDRGRPMAYQLFGTDGQPVYSSALGCAATVKTLDSKGRVLEEHYLDTHGNASYNAGAGACGFRVTYDENGNRQTLTALDANWQPTMQKEGYVTEYTQYNRDGQLLRVEYWDAEGKPVRSNENYAVVALTYDSFGNQTKASYLDEQGALCLGAGGYAFVEYSYERGNLVSCKYFNPDGEPVMREGGYHECRMTYDDKGNCIRWSYHDAEGNLSCSDGTYAVKEQRFDRYGNVTELFYLNADGTPYYSAGPNICKMRWYYDQNGRETRLEYLDANGNLIENESGYAAKEYEYDHLGRKIKETFLDKTGKLTLCDGCHAIVTFVYDAMGNQTEGYAFDKRGEPCMHANGYSIIKVTYEDGKAVSTRYYDTEGKPMMVGGTYFECRKEYDEKGNCILWSYYDTEGNLYSGEDSYAVEERAYDLYGNMILRAYYDKNGQPAFHMNIHQTRWEYDPQGNLIRQCKRSLYSEDDSIVVEREYNAEGFRVANRYYDRNGDPVMLNGSLHEYRMDYDDAGNCIRWSYYDTEGNLYSDEASYAIREQTYDSNGNVLTEAYFDKAGEPAYYKKYYRYEYVYDDQGEQVRQIRYGLYGDDDSVVALREYNTLDQLVRLRFFNKNGEAIMLDGDYHEVRMDHDDAGNCIRWSYYDTEGNLFCNEDTYAIREQTYDSSGNVLTKTYYNAQGEYAYHRSYYRVEYEYDAQGNVTLERYLVSDGRILFYVYTYDDAGNRTSESVYRQELSGNITQLK